MTIGRPECWSFSMDFLGGPDNEEVEAYVVQLERDLAAATKRADAAETDAKRWRWLRKHSWVENGPTKAAFFGAGCIQQAPEILDAKVDEEMKFSEGMRNG